MSERPYSTAPAERAFEVQPLRVYIETEPNGGKYRFDARCRVLEVTRACDAVISSARIDVYMGEFDSIEHGTEPALRPADVLACAPRPPWKEWLSPDQRILIVRDLPLSAAAGETELQQTVLLSGYCEQPEYQERESRGSVQTRLTLNVESVWKRHQLTQRAQIVGRVMRTSAAAIALRDRFAVDTPPSRSVAFGGLEDVVAVEAAPCIFNAGGVGNCSPTPISVQIDGETIEVHVFTADRDPDEEVREFWTWARIWRYLDFFHVIEKPQAKSWAQAAGLIAEGQRAEDAADNAAGGIFEMTALNGPDNKPLYANASRKDLQAPVDTADILAFALRGIPGEFVTEGLTVHEAMVLAADESGMHFWVRSERDPGASQSLDAGRAAAPPIERLYIQARSAGPVKRMTRLAVPSDYGRPASELLRENNLKDFTVAEDYTGVYLDPNIYGDVKRWECTFELVPGWRADANVDDVADAATARLYAKLHQDLDGSALYSDPWFERYHKAGANFVAHREVGRLWVLNEDGRCTPKLFGRTNGPFKAAAYAPWEPSLCKIKDPYVSTELDGDGVPKVKYRELEKGDWVYRPRPLRECLSADITGQGFGYYVEVSADGTAEEKDRTYRQLVNVTLAALTDRAGLLIDADDLTTITPWGEEVTDADGEPLSLWVALVENRLRVRITAVIEGDTRARPNLMASRWNQPIVGQATRQFDLSEKFRCNLRDQANSVLAPEGAHPAPGETPESADDLHNLQRAAEQILEIVTARAQPGGLQIPWPCEDYEVGDCISGIDGLGLEFYSHATNDLDKRRHPDVVAIKSTPADTHVILEDHRMLNRLEAGAFELS